MSRTGYWWGPAAVYNFGILKYGLKFRLWTENSWKQVCAQQSKSSISGWPRAWIHTVCGCGPSNAIFVFSSLNSVFSQKIDLWGCCFLCAVTGWFIARVSKLPWLWHSSNLFLTTTYAKQISMKGDTFRVKSNQNLRNLFVKSAK